MNTQVERDWFIKKTGSGAPTNELKKRYYLSQGATGSYLTELETSWLNVAIRTAGGTPSGNHVGDLWKQLLAALGLRVTNYLDDNKRTYYSNVA